MKTSSGFTVVELLVAITFLGLIIAISLVERRSITMIHADQDRKVAINAIHYNLEEVVKPTLNGYPRVLKAAQLKAMDSRMLKDPAGNTIGEADSDYRYEPTGCNGGDVCAGYSLIADLEREGDFVKKNR
jgi:hypothetical protein